MPALLSRWFSIRRAYVRFLDKRSSVSSEWNFFTSVSSLPILPQIPGYLRWVFGSPRALWVLECVPYATGAWYSFGPGWIHSVPWSSDLAADLHDIESSSISCIWVLMSMLLYMFRYILDIHIILWYRMVTCIHIVLTFDYGIGACQRLNGSGYITYPADNWHEAQKWLPGTGLDVLCNPRMGRLPRGWRVCCPRCLGHGSTPPQDVSWSTYLGWRHGLHCTDLSNIVDPEVFHSMLVEWKIQTFQDASGNCEKWQTASYTARM